MSTVVKIHLSYLYIVSHVTDNLKSKVQQTNWTNSWALENCRHIFEYQCATSQKDWDYLDW